MGNEVRSSKLRILSALMAFGFAATAAAQDPEFSFRIGSSQEFPIFSDGGSVLDYDLGLGRIDFVVGSTESFDDPFFCFDFADSSVAEVTLNAMDSSGNVVLEEVGLTSSLEYDLVNDIISLRPSSSVQCFYQSVNEQELEVFGLFGEETASRGSEPDSIPLCNEPGVGESEPCRYFANDFAAYPELELSFENFRIDDNGNLIGIGSTMSVVSGTELVYDLVLHNSGDASANAVALQEVFPSAEALSIGLTDGSWTCQDNWDGVLCPAGGTAPLRLQDLEIPAEATLTFTISRTVQADLGVIGALKLFAGAVNGPGKTARSSGDKVTLDVVDAL